MPCCEHLVCRSHAIATGRRQDRRRRFKVNVRTITSGTQTMNNAYISALAALAGSGIGALASVGTTWLTQLFAEFIDQASRVFADALTHQLDDLSKLVPLYATMGKLRLYASNETVLCADRVMSRILDAYYSPNVNFETERIRDAENYDVLRAFIAACQTELKSHAV